MTRVSPDRGPAPGTQPIKYGSVCSGIEAATPATKPCARCSASKPLEMFFRQRGGRHGRHSWCKPCYYAARGPRKKPPTLANRNRNCKTRYGITLAEVDAIFIKQGGVCAICSRIPGAIDTDAQTQCIAFSAKDHGADAGEIAPTLRAGGHDKSHANAGVMPAVAFHENQRAEFTVSDTCGSLKIGGGKPGQGYPAIQASMSVRRLTPRECERLQGFPDDFTLIPYRGKPAADGPRYKALGNSMAVPCMAWIGARIAAVDSIARAA